MIKNKILNIFIILTLILPFKVVYAFPSLPPTVQTDQKKAEVNPSALPQKTDSASAPAMTALDQMAKDDSDAIKPVTSDPAGEAKPSRVEDPEDSNYGVDPAGEIKPSRVEDPEDSNYGVDPAGEIKPSRVEDPEDSNYGVDPAGALKPSRVEDPEDSNYGVDPAGEIKPSRVEDPEDSNYVTSVPLPKVQP